MRAESIVELARMMGSDAKARKTYVQIQCPFAPFYHEKGTDNTPSCNVFVVEEGRSGWKCHSCGQHGTLPGMVIRWALLTKQDATPLLDLIAKEEDSVEAVCGRLDRKWDEKWRERDLDAVKDKDLDVFSEEELKPFIGKVPKYILDRGFALETCKAWQLGFDKEWVMDGVKRPRLTIPVRRRDGKLVGLSGRAIDDNGEGKYWNYWNFSKSHYLFGENMVIAREEAEKAREGDKYEPLTGIAVVEGYLDTIRWWEYEIPVVAAMGAHLSKEQFEMIKCYGRVYLALDDDSAGRSGVDEAVKTLRNRIPVFGFIYPPGKKDPKDCTKEEAWYGLENAKRLA